MRRSGTGNFMRKDINTNRVQRVLGAGCCVLRAGCCVLGAGCWWRVVEVLGSADEAIVLGGFWGAGGVQQGPPAVSGADRGVACRERSVHARVVRLAGAAREAREFRRTLLLPDRAGLPRPRHARRDAG